MSAGESIKNLLVSATKNQRFKQNCSSFFLQDNCTEKFAEEKLSSGSIQEGYSTIDEGLWVCPQCYEDFKNYYDMPLIPNNVTMVETGLNEGKTVTFSLNNERYILKKTDEKICVSHNGNKSSYSSFSEMKSNQKFYNKILDEVIDEIFMSIT